MDCDKKYIKMCEGAYKYLKPPKQESPPTVWLDFGRYNDRGLLSVYPQQNKFPIYRQDQLQEMLTDKYCIHDMILYFLDFVCEHAGWHSHEFPSDLMFDTFEQLWLAFIMKEKFNKTWLDRENGPGGSLMDFSRGEWV